MIPRSHRSNRRHPLSLMLCYVLTAALAVVVITGCEKSTTGPSDVEQAAQLVDEGFQLLAAAFESDTPNFQAPQDKFEQAQDLDPNNMDAKAGLAICEIALLSQNPQVLEAIGGVIPPGGFGKRAAGEAVGLRRVLGGTPQSGSQLLSPGGWLEWMRGRMAKVVQDQPPDLGPVQDAAEQVIIPVLDVVIALLESIEAQPSWQLVLTPELTGMQEGQLEIDVTDIYMLDGMVHALKAQLHFFVSYNLNTPDFTDITAVKAALNQTDGTFLTLRTTGATNLGLTRTTLLAAIGKMDLFQQSLTSETDDQTDDLIKIDPYGGGPTQAELEEVAVELERLAAALIGDSIFAGDFDGDGDEENLTVNFSSFFTSPASDPKQLMPPYHWNSMYQTFFWDGWPEDFNQFVFPDPTFGGIFPGLTTDQVFKAFFGIDWFPSAGPFGDGSDY